MCIESSNNARHRAPNQVLLRVHIAQALHRRLEHALHHLARNDRLRDDALAAPLDPVDRRRLLVRAVVARQREHDHVGELLPDDLERLLSRLRDHVHAHRVTRPGREPYEERPPGECTLDPLQTSEARCRIKCFLDLRVALLGLDERHGFRSADNGWEVNGRTTSHAISCEDSGDTSASVERLAATRAGCDKRAFGGGHRDGVHQTVNLERTSDTEGKGEITDDILAASTHDEAVVVILHRHQRVFQGLRAGSAG